MVSIHRHLGTSNWRSFYVALPLDWSNRVCDFSENLFICCLISQHSFMHRTQYSTYNLECIHFWSLLHSTTESALIQIQPQYTFTCCASRSKQGLWAYGLFISVTNHGCLGASRVYLPIQTLWPPLGTLQHQWPALLQSEVASPLG